MCKNHFWVKGLSNKLKTAFGWGELKRSFDYIYTLHIGASVYLLSCLVSSKQDKSDTSLDGKCNNWFHLTESETQELKTDYLLVSSAGNFCKQFYPRSGLAKCQAWSGTKLIDTLKVFTKSFERLIKQMGRCGPALLTCTMCSHISLCDPWGGHLWPQGNYLNKLGSGPLDDATYQISRL